MTFRVPVLDSIGNGTRITLQSGDDLEVGAWIEIVTLDANPAVRALGGNEITVFGRISSAGAGILAAIGATRPTIIDVEAGGLVSGMIGVQAGSELRLTNAAAILGEAIGVELNTNAAPNPQELFDQSVVNNGRIVGGQVGIGLAGLVQELKGPLAVVAPVERNIEITNFGTIRGGTAALDLRDLSGLVEFSVYNEGRIRGDVFLGAGDDSVINESVIRGLVDMGAGNDVFRPSGSAETVQGGAGIDTANYGLSNLTVILTLDSASNGSAGAFGDRMLGIENLVGSRTAGDELTGNGIANTLSGGGGDDTLRGMAGNDTLNGGDDNDSLDGGVGNDLMTGGAGNDIYIVDSNNDVVSELLNEGTDVINTSVSITLAGNVENGRITVGTGVQLTGNALANTLTGGAGADFLNGGAGVDTLTGGAGADLFRFLVKTQAGDQITDFTSGIDKISIDISVFGVNLPFGVLDPTRLVIRADNLAQDGNDTFIFRTTDQTLWLDANGSGAGGLTLVADMQAGATITASDFAIF